MPYHIPKEEKETIVLYNQSQEPILIHGYDPSLLRRLKAYSEKYPDLCRQVDNGKYPDYREYEIAKDRVSIRLLPPMNAERKQAAAERAKRMRIAKQKPSAGD